MPSANYSLKVGARGSPLSQAQLWEVHREIVQWHPAIEFCPVWITTRGDCDKKTSLRTLEKTDFFTREIDERQLRSEFRIAIHSAKDLPEPLAKGLKVVALTKGVDPSDVLVYNDLPQNPVIATSSQRREEMVKKWRPGCQFVDVRGTIEERLQKLDDEQFDGLVMAEAALIRLGLTHRKRLKLEGETAPLQGRLAVVAREGDLEMEKLFRSL
jgi:hydroxymethylbilane synthase